MEIVTKVINNIEESHITGNDFSELLHHLALTIPKRKLDEFINEYPLNYLVVNLRLFVRVVDTYPHKWIKLAQITTESFWRNRVLDNLTQEDVSLLKEFIEVEDISVY